MSFELPTIIIPALLYNMLLCGLAAALAFHVSGMVQRVLQERRVRYDE